jgi:hypothetical protein
MVIIIPPDPPKEPSECRCSPGTICWPCWQRIRPQECECPPGSRSTCSFCREYLPLSLRER